ncbi:MAG: flippase-like domain-containing protein [Candidatus Fermentibacteraceae bacterium]|nr:flippase-like domain-containing protein [Candidatus Fermentibacteraceae bacterium]MBN2609694.1 flippase-like domain-containing protein [Candidatus Fermentibacteraceae bacterium]
MRKTLLNILGLLLTVAALYYIVDSFITGSREAGGISNLLHFNAVLFGISFLLMLLHLVAAAWSWMLVCGAAGARISFAQAFNVHFLAQVGKYIPGKVWGAVGKIGLSRKIGITRIQTGHALVLESLFIVAGCLLMSLPVIPLAAAQIGLGGTFSVLIVAAAAAVVLFTAHPGAFRRLLKLAGRIAGREIDIEDPGFANVLKLLPVYILVFMLQGLAFVFLARSFGMMLPFWPGMFLLPTAVGIGFLAVFSPGGLGIREISLVWLIAAVMPCVEPGQASLVSIAARLWITAGEFLAFLAAAAWWGSGFRLDISRR